MLWQKLLQRLGLGHKEPTQQEVSDPVEGAVEAAIAELPLKNMNRHGVSAKDAFRAYLKESDEFRTEVERLSPAQLKDWVLAKGKQWWLDNNAPFYHQDRGAKK